MSNNTDEYWQLLHDVRSLVVQQPFTIAPQRLTPSQLPSQAARAAPAGAAGTVGAGAASMPGAGAAAGVGAPPPAAIALPDYADWSVEQRATRLAALSAEVTSCRRCPLSMGRHNAVSGEGVLDPLVMVVGEGPGADEDASGRPFVGMAGNYLDKWLEAIEIERATQTYITNIVKCRPPTNRDPKPEESDACLPHLREQIALVRPRTILTVGRISTRLLTGVTAGIGSTHGTVLAYHGIPVVPTYHPSGVLRNPNWRRPVWEDLKKLRQIIDSLPA